MSARSTSLLGYGLYFIDVLACLLFAITLTLAGARFGHERTVAVELPDTDPIAGPGPDVTAASIVVRIGESGLEILFEDEPVTPEELGRRLREAPPPSVVVRSETSTLASVIAIAHAAGVPDIALAYEAKRGKAP